MLGIYQLQVANVPDGMFQHQLTPHLPKFTVQPAEVSALSPPYVCDVIERCDAVSTKLGVVEIANACSAGHYT
jgi:hypothetical protein